jgi:hypothetical protein
VETAEREAAALRQLSQVFSSGGDSLFSPRQQGNFEQIVDHLTGSNFWRLFGQGPVRRRERACARPGADPCGQVQGARAGSDSVPAAHFRALQTRYKVLQREFDLFRQRQGRVCSNCVVWESKVSQLRRKIHSASCLCVCMCF